MVDATAGENLLPPMAWNAWGDPAPPNRCPTGSGRCSNRRSGCPATEVAGAGHRRGAGAPSALTGTSTATAWPRSSATDYLRTTTTTGCCTPAASRPRICCAASRLTRTPPMRCCLPGDEDEIARVLRLLLAARHRRGAVRRRHQRGRRPGPDPRRLRRRASPWTCAGSTPCTGSTRSPARPNSAPGVTGPDAERLLGERGFSLGPLPAELPVRHHRRVRGHPVLGAGLRRLRPVQRHGPRNAGHHPGGRPRPRPCARPRPPARTCASCSPAPRASSASSPGCDCGCIRYRRACATRRGRSRTSPPAPTRLRAVTQTGDRADRAAVVRRGRDRRQPGHHEQHRRADASPAGAWPSPCSRAPPRTPRAGTPRPRAVLEAHGGTSLGEAPGEGLGARPIRRALPARLRC